MKAHPLLYRSVRPRVPAVSVAALWALFLLSACGDSPPPVSKAAPGATPAAIRVTVQRVEIERVPIALDAVGQAEGSREIEIRARVSGILEKRLYAEGEPVRAGQTLFVIDRAQYEIAVAQARAALAQERARQEQAQREAERLKTLVQGRAISQREYDEAVSSARQAAAAVEGAQAKLAEAQLNLSYTNVTAPIGGITSRAAKSEGSLVSANTDLLTTITQVNPIWVRFALAEPDFDRIRRTDRRAQVQILNRDGSVEAAGGRLNFSGSTVDPKLGTVQLRAEFPNPGLKWLPGQFVRAQILAGEQQAFLVPQAAVVQTEQARFVWTVGADGKAVMRPIQTANWVGSNWVVTDGLNAGDPVIIDNLMKLKPGAPVEAHVGDAATPAASAPAPAAAKAPLADKR